MNFTQNEKINQVTERNIVVGIDIASEIHYARAFDWRGIELGQVFRFENSREGFDSFLSWMEGIQKDNDKDRILVGAEPTGHYWFGVASYLKQENIKLVLVNPFHVKRSKELDDNHPSKTDRKDPKTIAKLVIDGRYSEPYIPEGVYAELRTLVSNRIRLVKEIGIIKNRIARWLKIYFPEHTEVYGSFDAVSSMMVMKIAQTPEDIISLGADAINKLWRSQKLRAVGIKRANRLVEAAKESIGCKEGLRAARIEINMLLEDFENKTKQHESLMEEIDTICREIPGVEEVLKIKGVGLVTIAGFVSEVGDLRRFKSPKQIQKLAGLALKETSSGKHKGQTKISKRGRSRLRAVLFQGVMPLVSKNKEFKEIHKYYTTRRENPLKKKQSLIAICCKLIRVLYAMLTKDIIYDGDKLLSDIKRPLQVA